MTETLVIWTPKLPNGYGAFDQWEDDYCEICRQPLDGCVCGIKHEDDEDI